MKQEEKELDETGRRKKLKVKKERKNLKKGWSYGCVHKQYIK